MSKFPEKSTPPITPLNEEVYSDFSIEELEERLETGPWLCGEHSEACVRHTSPSAPTTTPT